MGNENRDVLDKVKELLEQKTQAIELLQKERAQLFRELDTVNEENRLLREEVERLMNK